MVRAERDFEIVALCLLAITSAGCGKKDGGQRLQSAQQAPAQTGGQAAGQAAPTPQAPASAQAAAGSLVPTAEPPAKVDAMRAITPEKVVVHVTKAVWLETPAKRFRTFQSAPKGTFQPWGVKGYDLGIEDFVRRDTWRYLEVLLTFRNDGDAEFVLKAEDIKVLCADEQISAWEILQVGVVDTYDTLVQKFMPPSLPEGKIRRLKQNGTQCPLVPGTSTWAIFVFEVPAQSGNCVLAVGNATKIRIS
jgi:hypothetical protein